MGRNRENRKRISYYSMFSRFKLELEEKVSNSLFTFNNNNNNNGTSFGTR